MEAVETSRVLVVDDEPQITRVLRTVLSSQGYQVRTAAEGESALTNFKEWSPELVITDLYMPHMDGVQPEAPRRDLRIGFAQRGAKDFEEITEASGVVEIRVGETLHTDLKCQRPGCSSGCLCLAHHWVIDSTWASMFRSDLRASATQCIAASKIALRTARQH